MFLGGYAAVSTFQLERIMEGKEKSERGFV
jgi:hypothetical protein